MQNAYGGIVNIAFIVVFLTIVSGFLAFSVAYNKAFRVKNKIISVIETKEGLNDDAKSDIKDYMAKIGFSYANANEWAPDEYKGGIDCSVSTCGCQEGYCYKRLVVAEQNKKEGRGTKVYYQVATAVSIDIPILNKIVPNLKMFQVSGTTSTFYEPLT